MFGKMTVLGGLLSIIFAAAAQGATVSIANFSGTNGLINVVAEASSEFPSMTNFDVARAFDGLTTTAWAANGNGTGGGDYPPLTEPWVTMDLANALLDGVGGPFMIDTFTFVERSNAGTGINAGRDQTASFRLQAYLDGELVFDVVQNTPHGENYGAGSEVIVNVNEIADFIRYTVLSRVNETPDGNVGAREFMLTGSVIPEPSGGLLLLSSLCVVAIARRRIFTPR